jgi:hypothetical protein
MPTPLVRHLAAALMLATASSAAAQARSAGAAPATPPPAVAPARPALAPESDSERAMGTWALVVFNTQPFAFPNTGGATPVPLTVYTLGLRHWVAQPWGRFSNWGVDLGVGLVKTSTSVTAPQTGSLRTSDGPSTAGLGLHVGLPLAMTHHQHATFELVPEFDVIYASETIPPLTGGEQTSYSGFSLRLGARAGFELYFGFVGIPQLAIEASMGAAITYDSVSSKVGPLERSTRQWGLATLRGTEPWSIFTGSVAAMYHF